MEAAFRRWPTILTKNWSEERYKAYEELHLFLARRTAGDLEVQRCLLPADSSLCLPLIEDSFGSCSLLCRFSSPFSSGKSNLLHSLIHLCLNHRHQRKMEFHHRPVRLQHADTPFLSFGIPIQLENREFVLAADVDDSVSRNYLSTLNKVFYLPVEEACNMHIPIRQAPKMSSQLTCFPRRCCMIIWLFKFLC